MPVSDQPSYVNGVAVVETETGPGPLLAILHGIEDDIGRVRGERNEPRIIDLDLLAYDAHICDSEDGVVLPHPRLHERAFVLVPLVEIAPDWRHPVFGASAEVLLDRLPPGQMVESLERVPLGPPRWQRP